MGGAYLPWFISSISMAILADIILSVFGYDRAIPQVASWALMQLGSAAGQWIPIWFFTDRFRQDWIDKGQSAATMDAMIHYAVGIWGIISVLVVASLSMIGVLIGRKVLKKYKKFRELAHQGLIPGVKKQVGKRRKYHGSTSKKNI
ncbi:hypothetical protein EfmAA610_29290 [Enterococcus faecium]|nr:hypothetical protein EfmAA610_29290 [Enterococcus faecium]